MKIIVFLLISSIFTFMNTALGQVSDKALEYRDFRSRITIPPYGFQKINKLLKTIDYEPYDYGDAGITALKAELYKALSLREKFTYTMFNPEVSSQNCAIFIPLENEDKLIFAHLISWVDESTWSNRQLNFLRENRDSVMFLIKESTNRSKWMGVNYKNAIVLINGWEMIPFIMSYYVANPKDKDALTVLLLLMKEGEYVPFLKSSSYKKLYGSDYNYENWIHYNTANEKLIMERATGYYKEKLER